MNPLSPPVCPSRRDDNTILKGLDIISRFFRSSAPAINFGGLLHKALCNVFFRWLFFWPLRANGSGGRFLVAEAAVDIHMRMKGAPPLLSCSRGRATTNPNSATAGRVGGTTDIHMSQKLCGKQGTRAVCQLLHSLGHPDCQYYPLCYSQNYFGGKRSREKNDVQAIWCDIFQIRIHISCFCCLRRRQHRTNHLHGVCTLIH